MSIPDDSVPPDQAWVARIRAGDESAFERLFREQYKALRRYAITLLHRDDVAEDVVQAVFLGMWARREELAVRSSLRAYLYAAVHHRAVQVLRQERVRDRHVVATLLPGPEVEASLPGQWPDGVLVGEELEGVLRAAIEALAPRTREAFELRRFQELSYEEIATVMGISVKTVGVHIGRALAELRKAVLAYLAVGLLLVL